CCWSAGCSLLGDEHAVHEELDRSHGQTDGLPGVRAREGVRLEPVLRHLRVEDLDRWCKSAHLHDVCVAAHVDGVVSVGGVHNDAVGLPVAGGPAEGASQVDIQAGDVCPGQVVDSYVV